MGRSASDPRSAIVRRLDRSGDGEYTLAGARCRLIDLLEVLSDTGLGKEMHSVISQGRVESIVTSKPRDRRLLIEEAAGLGKHRKRRRRAQLKLGAHAGEPRSRPRRRTRSQVTAAAAQAPGRGRRAARAPAPSDPRSAVAARRVTIFGPDAPSCRTPPRWSDPPARPESGSRANSTPLASGAARPRRRWRRAPATARNCPGAASRPSQRLTASAIGPTRSERRR